MISLFPCGRAVQDRLKVLKIGKVKMPGATASLRGTKYRPLPIHDCTAVQVKADKNFH